MNRFRPMIVGWPERAAGPHGRLCRCRTIALLLLISCVLTNTSKAQSTRQLLDEAVREYQAALDCVDREQRLATFHRAELLFARLTDENGSFHSIHHPDLYVNLGNAALGAERLGPAILAFRRALMLDPDHRRARQNLGHARSLLPDWVPRPSEGGLMDTFFAWSNRLAMGELKVIAACLFLLFTILMACAIRRSQRVLRNLAIIPASGWLLLLVLIWLRSSDHAAQAAVVVVPEVDARSADSSGAPIRLPHPLPGGTELEVIESRDGWTHVRLFDSRDAWLPASAIELVATAQR